MEDDLPASVHCPEGKDHDAALLCLATALCTLSTPRFAAAQSLPQLTQPLLPRGVASDLSVSPVSGLLDGLIQC